MFPSSCHCPHNSVHNPYAPMAPLTPPTCVFPILHIWGGGFGGWGRIAPCWVIFFEKGHHIY